MTSVPNRQRISKLVRTAENGERRPALIGYLTAGDPSPDRTAGLVAALARGGVDLIELGVPFSDPIADGPVIQRAADRALCAGTTLHRVLDIAREIREHSEVPLLLFTYMNPVMRYGLSALGAGCRGRGNRRLPADRYERRRSRAVHRRDAGAQSRHRVSCSADQHRSPAGTGRQVFERLRLSGVANRRHRGTAELSESALPLIERTRKVTDLPLAMGFGIATRGAGQRSRSGGGRRCGRAAPSCERSKRAEPVRNWSRTSRPSRGIWRRVSYGGRRDARSRAGQAC